MAPRAAAYRSRHLRLFASSERLAPCSTPHGDISDTLLFLWSVRCLMVVIGGSSGGVVVFQFNNCGIAGHCAPCKALDTSCRLEQSSRYFCLRPGCDPLLKQGMSRRDVCFLYFVHCIMDGPMRREAIGITAVTARHIWRTVLYCTVCWCAFSHAAREFGRVGETSI